MYILNLNPLPHLSPQGSNVRILELKKAYRDSPVSPSPQSKENKPRNEGTRPGYKDQLQPMREAHLSAQQHAAQREAQRDPLHNQMTRLPRDPAREQYKREGSRDQLRREQSREQIGRDRSTDQVHREFSKDTQREFQRDPQRQLHRDQCREMLTRQREQDRGLGAVRVRESSPRTGSRRAAHHERRSPALRRHSPPRSAQNNVEVEVCS